MNSFVFNMLPEIKYNFNDIEKETLNLMEYYENLRRKYDNNSYTLFSRSKDPRENRYFESFKKLLLISKKINTEIPCPKFWIKSQFKMTFHESIGLRRNFCCPPQYLFSKYAWRRYKNYIKDVELITNLCKPEKNSGKNTEYIKSQIKSSYNLINDVEIKSFGKKKVDFRNFFNNKFNWILIESGMISFYYLCLSKSFNNIKKEISKEINIDLENKINDYKSRVIYNKEIIDYAKSLFGEDINES
ncbi:MAG: hypothetical protein ACOCV1_03635 [Bacillota bacterium]